VIKKASALVHAGKTKQAEVILREAVAENSESAELHGALGKLYFSEQDYNDAVQQLNQATQGAPDSREYNMLLAAALLGAKRFAVAVNFLRTVQPQFDQYPEFHYSMGLAYYNLLQFKDAKVQLAEALGLDPHFEQAEFLLATSLASEGDTPQASGMLRTLTQQHPENAVYWITLGKLLNEMDETNRPEALGACRRALALAPKDPHTQFVTATVLLEEGDFAEARPIFERLVRIYPKKVEAHIALSRIYGRLGQRELAQKESQIVKRLQDEQTQGDSQ